MENTPNWIHLDLKGVIPPADEMLQWVDFLADAGFNGIVFEYEDRWDWQTFPGVFRRGYSQEEWQTIHQRCAELSVEVVPLIQTIGHLDWLLRHPQYTELRECGMIDEICPSNPDACAQLSRWIDEVIASHNGLRYMHLGGDEVWYMGSCGQCRDKIASGSDGKMSLYLDHMRPLLSQVLEQGVTPMIWADMFWPEERQHLAEKLPSGTILVDWQYGWLGPEEVTAGLKSSGRPVWAASAINCAYDMTMVVEPLRQRVCNIDIWHKQLFSGSIPGLIHTCWARSSSLRPLYGPLEAVLPIIIHAGNPEKAADHPLFQLIDQVDKAIYSDLMSSCQIDSLRDRINDLTDQLSHKFEKRCAQWWDLAIEYAGLRTRALKLPALVEEQRVTEHYTAKDWHVSAALQKARVNVLNDLLDWQQRASALWRQWGLSDAEEFFESRSGVLSRII